VNCEKTIIDECWIFEKLVSDVQLIRYKCQVRQSKWNFLSRKTTRVKARQDCHLFAKADI